MIRPMIRRAIKPGDIAISFPPTSEVPVITTTFDSLRSVNLYSPVFVLSVWGDGSGGERNPLINQSIQNAISGRAGFYYIPVWQVHFTKIDGTHPDEEGHKTLGTYIANQIKLTSNAF